MIKNKTTTGFEFEIDERALQNYELLELLNDVDENPLLITKVTKMLIGAEATAKLKDHVRDEDGFVSTEEMSKEIAERALQNYELLELLNDVDENPLLITKVTKMLIGAEATAKLKDHVRDEDGFVSTEEMSKEIADIFKASQELKN